MTCAELGRQDRRTGSPAHETIWFTQPSVQSAGKARDKRRETFHTVPTGVFQKLSPDMAMLFALFHIPLFHLFCSYRNYLPVGSDTIISKSHTTAGYLGWLAHCNVTL